MTTRGGMADWRASFSVVGRTVQIVLAPFVFFFLSRFRDFVQSEKWTRGLTAAHLITKVAAVCFAVGGEELAPLNHGGGVGEGQLSGSSSAEYRRVEQ